MKAAAFDYVAPTTVAAVSGVAGSVWVFVMAPTMRPGAAVRR